MTTPSSSSAPADRILTDLRIWTGVRGPDGALPRQTTAGHALAIRDGRILAEGPASRILELRGPHTAIQPLGGRTVLPGFVDAHVHLLSGGLELHRVQLRGTRSPDDLAQRIRSRARQTPGDGWILGGGWDHHAWGGTLPTREVLDRAVPHRPVFLLRVDLHMGAANSAALARAGIDAHTPDPPGGTIDRDPVTGEPTGILREEALIPMAAAVPAPTDAERESALMAAARHALSRGVTQVHDMGALQSAEESWASLEALRRLRLGGRLPLRVRAAVPLETRHRLADLVRQEGRGDLRLGWGAVKGFVDGSLGAGTAWMLEDYADEPGNRGAPSTDPETLARALLEAAELGLQPVVHAIGDRATGWLMDAFAPMDPASRPRMEHAQHLTPESIAMAGQRRAILSVQPAHLLDDGQWVERRLGPQRPRWAYPFRSLLDAGAVLAFGSDWTVAPMDPRVALAAAVHRIPGDPPSGEAGVGAAWSPGERIHLSEALSAHTLGGAVAAGLDTHTGTLEAGKAADLAILDADPFEVDPVRLPTEVQVHLAFVDGAPVWQSPDAPEEGLS